MRHTIHKDAEELLTEPCFKLFKCEGMFCCIQRVMHAGHLCGYVAVEESHPLYGKHYSDKMVVENADELEFNGNYFGLLLASCQEEPSNVLSIDMVLTVHGGITFTNNHLMGIEKDLLGKLWWFGFDTAHSGDLKPFQNDIDRKFNFKETEYRSFEYVETQVKKLAKQLAAYIHL